MIYRYTLATVLNRGTPPASFLDQLIAWAKEAPMSLFQQNDNPRDIYATVKGKLGPWLSDEHRRAVMCEVMRVHAGFESSWYWNEGVDTNNPQSLAHIEGQETGAWQVSFDSTQLAESLMVYARVNDVAEPAKFIPKMKRNHTLAMSYVARLYRVSVAWAGPIKRHEIDAWLSRDAVQEFIELLKE